MSDERVVYVVTSGSYSDYHIEHIFETREVAEAYKAATTSDDDYNDTDIEEWPLLPAEVPVERVRALKLYWRPDNEPHYAFEDKSSIDVQPAWYWHKARPSLQAGAVVELVTNSNHPDEWWIERAIKIAQDVLAFGEYERTANGLSTNEINALIGKRKWEAKDAVR